MPDTSLSTASSPAVTATSNSLSQFSAAELAQALLEKLAIAERDWHRLKSNRKVRANEQAAAAIVFLLKDQPEEALPRLQQAVAWLDRSISAPPCPSHGDRARE
ncbi:MAG: hypothetical protein KME42_18270 [Tildeniella nuda ZEHNDER 1965/U140]|jgi:hypothetical protein|nr:hypothetical protein [Tildeniella nuda ZEHNDER 1965/U140]